MNTSTTFPVPEYQSLSDLSAEMLAAARDAHWERVGVLEASYSARVQALKNVEMPESTEVRGQLAVLIKQILANEREVRTMVAQGMTHLSTLLSSAGAQRKLAHAYGGR